MEYHTQKNASDESVGPMNEGRTIGRREFLKLAGLTGAALAFGGGVGSLLAGCGGTTTSAAGSTDSTAAASAANGSDTSATSGGSSVSAGNGGKTLKVGMITDFAIPLYVDWQKEMDALIPAVNAAGGVTVAGEKYLIDVITYDGKASAETSRSAVQRLISEDKVQFILGDPTIDYWQPLVEAAKVVTIVGAPSQKMFDPANKYTFQSVGFSLTRPSVWGWYSQNYPDGKTICAAFPDTLYGHIDGDALNAMVAFGGQEIVKTIFYPKETTDFSAIATAVIGSNADWFTTSGGGPFTDCQFLKAVHQASYPGQVLLLNPVSLAAYAQVVSVDNFEGMFAPIEPTELPTPTAVTKELVDLYTAKYGEWNNPNPSWIANWYLLQAALEKSPGIDPDQVASTIAAGLEFDTIEGSVRMISRPDLGNSRAVDALYTSAIGQVKQGKWDVVGEIGLDDAYQFCKEFYKWS